MVCFSRIELQSSEFAAFFQLWQLLRRRGGAATLTAGGRNGVSVPLEAKRGSACFGLDLDAFELR